MKKVRLLYLGNNLSKKSKYKTTIFTLSELLSEEYTVDVYSDKLNKFRRLIEMCFQLVKKRKTTDFVLIDTFSTTAFYFSYITSLLARLFKLKYIPILHGGNLPERLDKSTKLSNHIFNNSYKNIAPSGYLEYEFNKRNYPTIKIPNVLELKNYNFKKRSILEPKLLYVRAFADIYNPKMAIYVLNELKKEFAKAKLCMVGPDRDGSLKEVENLVLELGLQDAVEFTGVLEKEIWHQKSEEFDVFINTTNFDNTPVSVMEVMALGIPIVSTNVGGVPYLLTDRKDAFLVEKNDVSEMVNAIKTYLKSPEIVDAFTTNARKKVEKFDWSYVKKYWNKILIVDDNQ